MPQSCRSPLTACHAAVAQSALLVSFDHSNKMMWSVQNHGPTVFFRGWLVTEMFDGVFEVSIERSTKLLKLLSYHRKTHTIESTNLLRIHTLTIRVIMATIASTISSRFYRLL
jgi:hypothetical protein